MNKTIHNWILAGAIFLSFSAGYVNAISISHQTPLTHATGSLSQVALNLENGDFVRSLHFATLIFSFFIGCVVSGFVVQDSVLKLGRRYGIIFFLEGICLFAAVPFLNNGSNIGYYIAAFAFGLQNSMATAYSNARLRTTHMTGLINDLGLTVGHVLRGLPVDWQRLQLYVLILSGFFGGGVAGMAMANRFGFYAFFLPATLMVGMAVVYTLLLQYIRVRRSPEVKEQWQEMLRRNGILYAVVRYLHINFSNSKLVVELEKLADGFLAST